MCIPPAASRARCSRSPSAGSFSKAWPTHTSPERACATIIEHIKPLTPQQATALRDKLKELQEKRLGGSSTRPAARFTAEDEKMLVEIRKKLATFVRRPSSPAIAETVTVEVTMLADASPGQRELRLRTPAGLSNPLAFCVGQLPEFSKIPARNTGEPRVNTEGRFVRQAGTANVEMTVTLPTIVNGQITPGGVDRYRFKASKGQKLVMAVSARELIPYIPDAVPGWFQATLALYDAKGNELAYAEHYSFHPDPVVYYEVPADGEYVAEIRDSIYRGREDFVYRISIGEMPFVTGIFPLGGRAGEQTTIEVRGWNLPADKLAVDARDRAPGILPVFVRKGELTSNLVPFAMDSLPECMEQEPNDDPGHAQRVTLPVIVNGRIDRPGDWDVFSFEGRAGEEIVAEVYARRLDSPLDSVLRLTDSAGKQLAFNDDHEDKGAGLLTHYADSYLRAMLPASGTYFIHIGDIQHQGGPEYAYRLRIGPRRPDYELRVVPASVDVRTGGTATLTVHVLRKDGFAGEIALALKNAPVGFALSGAKVPAGQDQVRLTLTVPATASKEPLTLSVEGRAMIQGRDVVRRAVPAEDMMQAFAYRHLVPAAALEVAVSGRWMPRSAMKVLSPTVVRVYPGGTARILVSAPASTIMGKVEFELSDAPDGIAIKSVSQVRDGTEIVLQSDAAKTKPGFKGNLIINAVIERSAAANGKPQANKRRVPLGTLPAIPFETLSR